MAIDTPARHIYSGDGSTRVFPIPTYIQGDDYIRIEINGVHQVDRSKWDIVNNSIIFVTAPITTATIDVQVATSVEALSNLGSVSNVDIVASDITKVNIVANNISEVVTVGDNIDVIINNDAGMVNIATVAGNIGSVNTIATNIANVNSVVANNTNVNTIATNITNVNNVGNNISKVNTVSDNIADVSSIVDNLTTIQTATSNLGNISLVGLDLANTYEYIEDNGSILDSVSSSIGNSKINTVANDITNVNTVATDIANVNSVAGNTTNINTVASNTSNINSIATTIVPNITEILQADNNALLAKNYATADEDVEVETGLYSSKHWATKASELVTNGVIDDTTPSTIKTYSSTKINTLLDNKLTQNAGVIDLGLVQDNIS